VWVFEGKRGGTEAGSGGSRGCVYSGFLGRHFHLMEGFCVHVTEFPGF